MCRCIESICVDAGRVCRLEYHQRRVDATRRALFPGSGPLSLTDALPPVLPAAGLHKLRITYGRTVTAVELEPYRRRVLRSLTCVEVGPDEIDYRFKWADRSALQRLLARRDAGADDIIIVRDGYLSDSSYSNLALLRGSDWVTPSTPLLAGTMRAYLLECGSIIEAPVRLAELHHYSCVSLINAMNPLGALVVPLAALRLPGT